MNLSSSRLIYPKGIRFCSLFFIILFLCSTPLLAQKTKSQLEKEKNENLRKIAEAEKILSETESEKKATIGQLTAINQQINARLGLINALNEEVVLLDEEIDDLTIVVQSLQRDLTNLKDEYAQMVYSSYKSSYGFNVLTFLFSASTFNQLYMRLKYLEQYSEARMMQANQIQEVTKALNTQREEVQIKRDEQTKLLEQQILENRKLVSLKNRQNRLIAELNQKESELRKEMADRKKSVERLDRLIADLIAAELERSRNMSSTAIADVEAISSSFEQNRRKLQWPVASGFVSSKFGKQPHPVWKNVLINNTGVDIQTNKDEDVMTVFEGEVKTKAFVPGMNNVVIVKHGNYYTVYSRLKEVNVEKGQKLRATDVIGKVHTNTEGISEVHFEVWRNTEKLDPEKWLSN